MANRCPSLQHSFKVPVELQSMPAHKLKFNRHIGADISISYFCLAECFIQQYQCKKCYKKTNTNSSSAFKVSARENGANLVRNCIRITTPTGSLSTCYRSLSSAKEYKDTEKQINTLEIWPIFVKRIHLL